MLPPGVVCDGPRIGGVNRPDPTVYPTETEEPHWLETTLRTHSVIGPVMRVQMRGVCTDSLTLRDPSSTFMSRDVPVFRPSRRYWPADAGSQRVRFPPPREAPPSFPGLLGPRVRQAVDQSPLGGALSWSAQPLTILSRPSVMAMTRCRSTPSQGLPADRRITDMVVFLPANVGFWVANHSAAAGRSETSDVKTAGHRDRQNRVAPRTRPSRPRFVRNGGLTTKLGRASRAAIVSRR